MSGGKYRGIAPKCRFIAVKVLDSKGNGSTENVLKGLDWVMENAERYRIQIVNISVGTVDKTEEGDKEELIQKVEEAWDKGLIVVAASGNNGPEEGSVTVPGASRKVITVGCSDDQLKAAGGCSGRGPTKLCICKPEIVAPGYRIMSLNVKNGYGSKSGTSMATPIVSGCIALLLEQEPFLTNKEIKMRLHDSAVDLGMDKKQQGWGIVDIKKLLQTN